MIDFGTLPPEVNSARVYAGPGSDPILASAAAWQAIASQLISMERDYTTVIAELQGQTWSGSASDAMAAAAGPYVQWLAQTAATAEDAAGQARAAAAAYETARAAAVPPESIVNNRAQYEMLSTANLFGNYTTELTALEADYAEMWARDAQVMYTYAGAASGSTALSPFTSAPPTTTTTTEAEQTAAVANSAASQVNPALNQLIAAIPQHLQSLAAAGSSSAATSSSTDLLTGFGNFNTLSSPSNLLAGFGRTFFSGGSFLTGAYRSALQAKDLPKIAEEDAAAAAKAGGKGAGKAIKGAAKASAALSEGMRAPTLASVGRAAPIGGLSVPQSWASATPIASAVEQPAWLSEADLATHAQPADAPAVNTPGAGPTVGVGQSGNQWARPTVNNVLRVPTRGFKMPRPAIGG